VCDISMVVLFWAFSGHCLGVLHVETKVTSQSREPACMHIDAMRCGLQQRSPIFTKIPLIGWLMCSTDVQCIHHDCMVTQLVCIAQLHCRSAGQPAETGADPSLHADPDTCPPRCMHALCV
jgi:hypothetical protein